MNQPALRRRQRPIEHLPFGSYFMLKSDLTVFQLVEKDFFEKRAKAHVVNHPELIITFAFSRMAYPIDGNDLEIITLLLKDYNLDEEMY